MFSVVLSGADPGGGSLGSEDPPSGPACCISMYDSVNISKQTSAYPPRGVPSKPVHVSRLNQRCCGWRPGYTDLARVATPLALKTWL